MACLAAIEKLGWPLDRIITADVWATDTLDADLPPMVEFKAKADELIKQRYGITVEHFCASMMDGEKATYERYFYQYPKRKKSKNNDLFGKIRGWPMLKGPWCNGRLKMNALAKAGKSITGDSCQYLGIAADEPIRIERHTHDGIALPLVAVGWDEAYCRKLCEENGWLSPIYAMSNRGGCWFCHNQGLDQLRKLRKNYPDLWQIMLKWDSDSAQSFRSDRRTVHDYDMRFSL